MQLKSDAGRPRGGAHTMSALDPVAVLASGSSGSVTHARMATPGPLQQPLPAAGSGTSTGVPEGCDAGLGHSCSGRGTHLQRRRTHEEACMQKAK